MMGFITGCEQAETLLGQPWEGLDQSFPSSESLFWVPSSGLVQVGFLITKPGNNNFEFQSL